VSAPDIQVAIPSYHRAAILAKQTLPMLADGGVPARCITVFVGDENEAAQYTDVMPAHLFNRIHVTGASGSISGQRNAIQRAYPIGTKLVHCDDDIRAVLLLRNEKLEQLANVYDFFTQAFARAALHGAYLWGVYPTANQRFMKHRSRVGLAFIIGALFGTVIRGLSCEQGRFRAKEDYERSIRYYIEDGCVMRWEDVALRTSYNGTAGGQADARTPEIVAEAVAQLQQRWPELVHINRNRKSGLPEIVLRDARKPVPG
jgi:hypothetical protein